MDEPVGNTSAVEQIKSDVQSFMSLVPGGKVTSLGTALSTILNAVQAVEKLAGDLAGADKKALVFWVLNQYVHIPLVPQFLVDDVAGYLIDAFVAWLNAKLGKDWISKIA